MSKLGPTLLQTAAVATANGNVLNVGGMGTVGVMISGITTATITFEATINSGATAPTTGYVAIKTVNMNSQSIATTATADGIYLVPVGGFTHFRARISAWTSGTITVIATAVDTPISDFLSGSGGDATAANQTTGNTTLSNIQTYIAQMALAALIDDDPYTVATDHVVVAGFMADEVSTDSVNEGDAGAARMTLDRKQIVVVDPHTIGGWLTAMMTGADGSTILTNAAQAIKASAGVLGGWYIYNPNVTAVYISIYNTAAGSVTVGTTNPQMSLCIPATSAANLLGTSGVLFTNAGFSVAATTTAGGNTAPSTGVEANFFYV